MDRLALRRVGLDGIPPAGLRAADREAETVAQRILDEVREGGEPALRRICERLGEVGPGEALFLHEAALRHALGDLDRESRELLERSHARVLAFATAQRACLLDLDLPLPGGRAGHRFLPVARAGCYVPGGRYPLPSSALMTVTPAKAAGVSSIWCAGPRPSRPTLAAAALAGADGFVCAGGAQAIAALAFGCGPVAPRDVVVGPGGRYVAAAKRLLSGIVGTEAPAGPSELLIVADGSVDPALVAADMLAQAEHDPEATAALVTFADETVRLVELELARALALLPSPNAEVAERSLGQGSWAFVASSREEACAACRRFAPEHLELLVAEPEYFAERVPDAGAVFLGPGSAEVLGDYGAGPNHCLPTGGAARFAAGLSVLDFLRPRTYLRLDEPQTLAADAALFARIEGLEAHARSAELRLRQS
ncbi:MAG TPA: histidinol dehydrogenase [Rectinemataceae bacterium]|nr:histidinol dehydrogenase [Rectinemataceae bacterium]